MNAFLQSEHNSRANLKPSIVGKKVVRINAVSLGKLVRLLMEGESTLQELREETGLHSVTISNYIKELRKSPKACYIKEWAPNTVGRAVCAVYKIGRRPDAVRPRMTPAQRSKKRRDATIAKREQMKVLKALTGELSERTTA